MNPLPVDSARFPSRLKGAVALRLAWVTYLAATAMGSVAVFYSMFFMRADFLAGAVVAGGIAWLVRLGLRDRLADLEAEGDVWGGREGFTHENRDACDGRLDGVVKLLREWDGLEQSRGKVDFDPWALQSVRNEIRSTVHGDPALARLLKFRD